MAEGSDTFRMNPISLCALVGGVVAFVLTGAIVDVLWVAIGALLGAGIGYALRRYAGRARNYADAVDLRDSATKDELMEEARRLDVPGRASMTKDELVQAISERRDG
jgi:hypothetical protein